MTALDEKLRYPQPGDDLSQLARRANEELEGATAARDPELGARRRSAAG